MNQVILTGRLTADPEVRYSQGENSICTARYTLAVDKGYKVKDGEPTADFIRCVAFGKLGEFAEKYLHKGIKIAITGRINTGSYTNNDGQKVYTTDVVVTQHEFCESKSSSGGAASSTNGGASSSNQQSSNGFMSIPDGVEDEDLPWN